jgi:hypothetical protein
VPFLTWMGRFSSMVGQPDMPKVADLTRPALGYAVACLLALGVAALASGAVLGSEAITRAGALCYAAGAGTVLVEAWLLLRRRSPA